MGKEIEWGRGNEEEGRGRCKEERKIAKRGAIEIAGTSYIENSLFRGICRYDSCDPQVKGHLRVIQL